MRKNDGKREPLTRERAFELAQRHQQSICGHLGAHDFEVPEWVINAIMEASK